MKRVTYIDSAKGLGIIFVVTAHLLGALVFSDPKPLMEPIWKFLCASTIAFFFVSSGLTINITKETSKNFKEIFKKKLKSVFYPYLTFSIIYLIYNAISLFVFHKIDLTINDVIKCMVDFLTLKGYSVMWFLSALFIGSLLFDFLYKKIGRVLCFVINITFFVLTVIFSDLFTNAFWSIDLLHYIGRNVVIVIFRSFCASFFINIGYELANIINKFKWSVAKKILISICAIALIGLVFILSSKATVDFANNNYENPMIAIFSMIIGSIALTLICFTFLDLRILQYLGSKSLIIMVSHLDFQVLTYSLSIAYAVNMHVSHAKEPILYISILGLIVLFEAIWIWLFDHPLKFLLKKG